LPRDDFYTPTDIDALRMENELLVFEARFLRTQLTERAERMAAERVEVLEHSITRLKDQLKHSERRLEESERRLEESERRLEESERSATQLSARLAEAERAEQDIVLLLNRLANSPFGWFFGTKQNFRILERRYLGNDD
jgi:DNA repair exonuclease SbcCD ATPase subunit